MPTLRLLACAVLLALAPSAAAACTVTPAVSTALGSYSPPAVQSGAIPAVQSRAGMSCASSTLTLLGGNTMRAKFRSANALKLVRQGGGTGSIAYVASADPNGTYRFGQDVTIDYMQNNLLNLLGLLGGSNADLPFFVTPSAGAAPAAGTYRDTVTIDWSWYQCPGGVNLVGVCLGGLDTGTGRTTIELTLVVAPQNLLVTIASKVTWDPVSTTYNPKMLPGARLRTDLSLSNPDLVPLDTGSASVTVPTPGKLRVALDGDGASAGAAIRLVEGSPASGLALRYGTPADTTDDVDFSSDGGASWGYAPVAGNAASEAAITHVRLRPRGAMAKQSNVVLSLPYTVR